MVFPRVFIDMFPPGRGFLRVFEVSTFHFSWIRCGGSRYHFTALLGASEGFLEAPVEPWELFGGPWERLWGLFAAPCPPWPAFG